LTLLATAASVSSSLSLDCSSTFSAITNACFPEAAAAPGFAWEPVSVVTDCIGPSMRYCSIARPQGRPEPE
jgi:hypothetical protein